MTAIRADVHHQTDGWTRLTVSCDCAKVGRHIAPFENVEAAIHQLRQQQHRLRAPECPHPWQGEGRPGLLG